MGKRRPYFNAAETQPITRDEAAIKGYTHYYTGKPCGNGHLALRYVSTMACVDCMRPPIRINPRGDQGWNFNLSVKTPAQLTLEQYRALEAYLQLATEKFCAAHGY